MCRFDEAVAVETARLGDQDQLFPPPRARQRNHRVSSVWHRGLGNAFGGGERHHLTPELGEALHAAHDRGESVGIDGDNIPGVVPSLRRLFDLSAEHVTDHHIGTAYKETPSLGDARYRVEAMFDQRQKAADGPRAVMHRRIDRNDWRAFGDAVAFE